MRYNFDKLLYDGEKFRVEGWACPEHKDDQITISLEDMQGNPLDCEIQRIFRTDVYMTYFGEMGTEKYGFYFNFQRDQYEDVYIRFKSEHYDYDFTGFTLDFPGLLENYKKDHTFFGTRRRMKAAPDKKAFKIGEKYFHLVGDELKYAIWYEMNYPGKKELGKQKKQKFEYMPLISIVVPVYQPGKKQFGAMIQSVLSQTYGNFELCLADGSADHEEIRNWVKKYGKKDARIKVTYLENNGGISENTNAALGLASGEWVALLDQDDFLREDALYRYVEAMNENPKSEVFYSDEDKFDDTGAFHLMPYFKTDFNDALLHCNNYICHFFMVKKEIADQVGNFRKEYDGAQDYDFILRCTEATREKIVHIPYVLYSWRIHSLSTAGNIGEKEYAIQAGKRALEDAYRRKGLKAEVTPIDVPGAYKTMVLQEEKPLVSVLIPNKDHDIDLDKCIQSLQHKSRYKNIEILIIENNSTEEVTKQYYEVIQKEYENVRVLTYSGEFNYSAINNFGAKEAKGEYLLLLNNDTEVISPDFLDSMLSYMANEKVGAVGAKLYYEDRTIQHAGVLVGVGGAAHHVYLNASADEGGYMGRLKLSSNLSAVTAACMLVRKSAFDRVDGLDERFTVAYNDVDFCLKLVNAGYDVVYDAFAELFHYESKSRGYEDTDEKKARFEKETALLFEKWPEIKEHDPYYNINLSMKNGCYKLP